MAIKRQTYINGSDLKVALRERTKDFWSEDSLNRMWTTYILNGSCEAGEFIRVYDSLPELLEASEKEFYSYIVEILKDGYEDEKSFDIKLWR